jgi:peptide/bleomycin uptake transporter
MKQFVYIVMPALVVHPLSMYIRSRWALAWRLALINVYLNRWDPDGKQIEGASQRVQEDTARLARSCDTGLSTVVSSIATLLVFLPLLYDLGGKAVAPSYMQFLGKAWLLQVAVFTATAHLGGAWMIGQPLVFLEVNNQKKEAEFRRRLVLSEAVPAGEDVESPKKDEPMGAVVEALRQNYLRLFTNFFLLNSFLTTFDQTMIVVPYLLCAPLLFAPADSRIQLGVLVQVTNAFGKVFGALSVVAESVAEINDFRSTLYRLREFERKLSTPLQHRHNRRSPRLMPATEPRSDFEEAEVVEMVDPPVSPSLVEGDMRRPIRLKR